MKSLTLITPKILLFLLMAGLGLIYGAQTGGQLVYDDQQQIDRAQGFQSIGETFTVDCFGLFRPVKNLIFYVWIKYLPENHAAWRLTAVTLFLGLIPVAYRFFGLFFKQQPWLQCLATALWASAPAATSVVSWISSTNITVGGYGFFLYFILYEKAQERQQAGAITRAYAWLFGALLMLAFACFSYEAAMAAPFLLLLKDYVRDPARLKDKRTWLFFSLSLFTLSLYFLLRKFHGGVTTFDTVPTIPAESDLWVSLSSGWFYCIHAFRWIWPFGYQGILIMFNPENHRTLVLVSAAVVLGLAILLWVVRKRQPLLFLALGWYGLALFPMANVLPLRNGPICDYYLFLPSIGLALLVVWTVQRSVTSKARSLVFGVSVLWVLLFCATTYAWVPQWKTKKALAEKTLAWQPDNFVILGLLAQEALDESHLDQAETYLERGLQLAPWLGSLHYEKAMLYKAREDYDTAIAILETLIEGQGHLAKPYVILAYIYDIHLGQWQKAESLLATAMEKPWDHRFSKTGAMNLAYIYLKTGRRPFAAQVYQSLLERYPLDPEIVDNYNTLIAMETPVTLLQDPAGE